MDFLSLGINLAVVAGIIGITEMVKTVLPEKLLRFVILVPTILGVIAAMAIGWGGGWKEVVKDCIIYVGAATYIWRFGKTVVAGQ
jgi:glucose-6-phosphate-specific signal transduction histidine kinase